MRTRRPRRSRVTVRDIGGLPLWAFVVGLVVVAAVGFIGLYLTFAMRLPGATPPERTPVALFIGDSYSAGVGASDKADRWTSLVASAKSWDEQNYARGGTGYFRTAGASGCGRPFCPAYQGMIDQAVKDGVTPDFVFIAGGQNDSEAWLGDPGSSSVREAITKTYARARIAFPNARIVAVGPSWLGTSARWQSDFDKAVATAAANVDAQYISLRNPAVLGDPAMEMPDGAHVNERGHRAIANRVIAALD